MENRIKEMIQEIKEEIDIKAINNNSNLGSDLGLDSLNLAILTVKIENEYDIDIFENGIVVTFGEIIEMLSTK